MLFPRPDRGRGVIILPMNYHIWTIGCQMNVADSQRLASALEQMGLSAVDQPEAADIIILNTCVVRQSAEDRAVGRLSSLKPLKQHNPELIINLMGCMVGVRSHDELERRFPYVDVFSPPSDLRPLMSYLFHQRGFQPEWDFEDPGDHPALLLPERERGSSVSAYIPIVLGCSHACAYCIIPYRRGPEISRPAADILEEVRSLAAQGIREVTLLGQIVDRYGLDLPGELSLSGLLREVHAVEGIERIRFLTSHPNWMSDELLDTVAALPKVCEHFEVPVQAGSNEVLEGMRRGYTSEEYRALIGRIRQRIPAASIANDIIVGFPGETDDQFHETEALIRDLRLDVVHLARYSPRPGTLSERKMEDNVPAAVKMQRFRILENIQARIAAEINADYLDRSVEVLIEERQRGRWKGRTRTNKLVFVESEHNLNGKLINAGIIHTSPWSMRGNLESVEGIPVEEPAS